MITCFISRVVSLTESLETSFQEMLIASLQKILIWSKVSPFQKLLHKQLFLYQYEKVHRYSIKWKHEKVKSFITTASNAFLFLISMMILQLHKYVTYECTSCEYSPFLHLYINVRHELRFTIKNLATFTSRLKFQT